MCQPGWKQGLGENGDTCICMAESVGCSSGTITTLLVGYTPIQNTKFTVSKKRNVNQHYFWYPPQLSPCQLDTYLFICQNQSDLFHRH